MLIINTSKDVEEWEEKIYAGMTFGELIFAVLGLLVSIACILLLHLVAGWGLTTSVYLSLPVAIPIFLCGFYKKDGLNFLKYVKRSIHRFRQKGKMIYYVSTENDYIRYTVPQKADLQKDKSSKDLFEQQKRKMFRTLIGVVVVTVLCLLAAILSKILN